MEDIVRIPEARIGVLIGPRGSTRKEIEKKTDTTLDVSSETGEVFVSGEGENFFKALDIVKAIGRGFSPKRAFFLLKDDCLLKIIEIEDYVGKNESAQKAKRGRVIGRNGLARKNIEKKTHSLISVQGKTIAIIAKIKDIEAVLEAVEALLGGAEHKTIMNAMERKGKERFEL